MIIKTLLFKAKSKKHKYKEDYRDNETKYLENLECVVAISRKANKLTKINLIIKKIRKWLNKLQLTQSRYYVDFNNGNNKVYVMSFPIF